MKINRWLYPILTLFVVILICETAFSAEESECIVKEFSSKLDEIKRRNPKIPLVVLEADLAFLENNLQKSVYAKPNVSLCKAAAFTAKAWADLRIKNEYPNNVVINSMDILEKRYGILTVTTTPVKNATVILNEDEEWDEKTDASRAVVAKTHLVEVKLTGYEPEPRQKHISVSAGKEGKVKFVLRKVK